MFGNMFGNMGGLDIKNLLDVIGRPDLNPQPPPGPQPDLDPGGGHGDWNPYGEPDILEEIGDQPGDIRDPQLWNGIRPPDGPEYQDAMDEWESSIGQPMQPGRPGAAGGVGTGGPGQLDPGGGLGGLDIFDRGPLGGVTDIVDDISGSLGDNADTALGGLTSWGDVIKKESFTSRLRKDATSLINGIG